ncbi:MAG: restriction endonuclease subunit S, partial [Burkholderiaceae bacterium]
MKVKREKYTPSDIGPTPSDWEDPYLKDVSIFISNGFVGTATPFYTGSSGVAYLYGTNVRENNVDLKNTRYITKEFHNRQKKTELRTGDLVTVQSGHIGTTAVIPLELEGANCHALIITRLDASIMNPEFLSEYLNSEIGKARLRGLYVGSSILHINTKDLKRFRVPLPNVKEQEKIIHILNAWNKAIDLVELFIQNSEKKKKAIL